MTVILLDTETTARKNPEVIELAFIHLNTPTQPDAGHAGFSKRYKPTKPITLGALAVHHILDEELADAPPAETAPQDLPADTQYIVGHNVDYDWSALGQPEIKRIDTLALARTAWPQLDSHSIGALIYHLYRDTARQLLQNAHSALHDVHLTRRILQEIVAALQTSGELSENPTWDELYTRSELSRIPLKFPFGKHAGTPLKDVPHDYIRWALRNITDMDPYLHKGLTAVLNKADT